MPFTATLADKDHQDLAYWLAIPAEKRGAYSCFIRQKDKSIISITPECFLQQTEQKMISLPIKGTRPRISGKEVQQRAQLREAAKDNAELAMITDLVRNDFGRVAAPGSVKTAVEPHIIDLPYVHHLVSEVTCTLAEDCSWSSLFRATYPAGSITGAPKDAAMSVIRASEDALRGPYCGTVGWIGSQQSCALSVMIRTAIIKHNTITIQAGGGIVADSEADAEWQELHDKAAPLLQVIKDHIS